MKLSDVKVDQMATIRALGTDTHFLSRVTSVGMTEGTRVQVVRNDKKMPLLIYVRETLLALNRKDCERIEVEVHA